MNLERIKGNSYYFTGRLAIGVYLDEEKKSAILIDSGLDEDTARKVGNQIGSAGYNITAIINTHSHADHCGGNNFLQRRNRNLQIYATDFERVFIEDPFLEPFCFCAGATPYKELRNKLLEAKSSRVTKPIPYEDSKIEIEGVIFDTVTLPGHTPGMIGVISPDGVIYCGDSIFGEETLDKHGILFYTDILKTKESLNKLRSYSDCEYLLYHGGHVKNIESLIGKHLSRIEETKDFIGEVIRGETDGVTLDILTGAVMDRFKIAQNVVQHTLTQTCVRSYVSQLQQEGSVLLSVKEGSLYFSSVRNLDVM